MEKIYKSKSYKILNYNLYPLAQKHRRLHIGRKNLFSTALTCHTKKASSLNNKNTSSTDCTPPIRRLRITCKGRCTFRRRAFWDAATAVNPPTNGEPASRLRHGTRQVQQRLWLYANLAQFAMIRAPGNGAVGTPTKTMPRVDAVKMGRQDEGPPGGNDPENSK